MLKRGLCLWEVIIVEFVLFFGYIVGFLCMGVGLLRFYNIFFRRVIMMMLGFDYNVIDEVVLCLLK